MTEQTLKFLHDSYNHAAQQSRDILEIITNFYDILCNYTPENAEDTAEFDMFLRNIFSSIKYREKTYHMTNFLIDVAFTIMHIAVWMNQTQNADIDVNLTGRRKSLESELEKLLTKQSIHDLFGMRAIILNNNSPEDSKNKLYMFASMITGILTKSNRKAFKNFSIWIEQNSLELSSKERLKNILKMPFKIIIFKDYVVSPKENDYQSIHYVFTLESFSPILPGAEFELQLRTNYMHQTNVNGTASHSKYKEERNEASIFRIDEFSQLKIIGFTSYNSPDDDIDGIHFAKFIINRRISSSLVPIKI